MSEYNNKVTRNLLSQYLTLREFLCEGTGQSSPTTQYLRKGTLRSLTERPLGATADSPHPFQVKNYAQSKPDGKAKARAREELHTMLIDLETGLSKLSNHDRNLLIDYFVYEAITLDELCEQKNKEKPAVAMLIKRTVDKLAEAMNNERA